VLQKLDGGSTIYETIAQDSAPLIWYDFNSIGSIVGTENHALIFSDRQTSVIVVHVRPGFEQSW
jgi:hypothetical protein